MSEEVPVGRRGVLGGRDVRDGRYIFFARRMEFASTNQLLAWIVQVEDDPNRRANLTVGQQLRQLVESEEKVNPQERDEFACANDKQGRTGACRAPANSPDLSLDAEILHRRLWAELRIRTDRMNRRLSGIVCGASASDRHCP
jgi:hypothetical protein